VPPVVLEGKSAQSNAIAIGVLCLILLALGAALAFSNWLSLAIVLAGIVPTFAWRARVEERLLGSAFGERFAVYRGQTKMIIPGLL
jgi:protein-S-isoprenylcysteine O-methyltransferase Ste14